MREFRFLFVFFLGIGFGVGAGLAQPLPGTEALGEEGDLAARMVQGIDAYLMRQIENAPALRDARWRDGVDWDIQRDTYRAELCRILGVVDRRDDAIEMKPVVRMQGSETGVQQRGALLAENEVISLFSVRWTVFGDVEGEGILLEPKGGVKANVLAIPDCEETPEKLSGLVPGATSTPYAYHLAAQGCRVLVPFVIDRASDFSGIEAYSMTNQPHREYLYRAAYEMGRHVAGYEVQKVLAGVDWFQREFSHLPVGVAGYGEGGMLALYSAACDERIQSVLVSGYFQPRESLWLQPIYRNVWSLLNTFGDAELVCMIAPRHLVVEYGRYPVRQEPPQRPGRGGGAPGELWQPAVESVRQEVQRAETLGQVFSLPLFLSFQIVNGPDRCADSALQDFLAGLGFEEAMLPAPPITADVESDPTRRKRQFTQILEHTQHLMREAEFTREAFWAKADFSSLATWRQTRAGYAATMWDELVGRLPEIEMPCNPRTRQVYDEPLYTGYEVMLDVYPDVFAYGILLLPKGMDPGEKRPVVVCQHGLEGRPQDLADPGIDNSAYHQYACRLAEQGFIVYAPQNPYIGEDRFRVLLRKAQPLRLTLFSFIVRQHQQTLNWLKSLDGVDPERIAFYGLSYGGKTAMRVPALLEDYCLSICSADYNEWIWKNVSARHKYSYLLTNEYDMPEFNMGNTFNYAELSWLICPRPFMVERGHHDGVAPDEWVAYEYARTFRRYNLLGIGDRTAIEFFDGPHSIHAKGTFAFLKKHLRWPVAEKPGSASFQ
ncbi:MAG: hypothetical protein RBU29_01320 [bacterium]|jgi:dienelactone hydrolase|nr:hypothetical protein [bacterium]